MCATEAGEAFPQLTNQPQDFTFDPILILFSKSHSGFTYDFKTFPLPITGFQKFIPDFRKVP